MTIRAPFEPRRGTNQIVTAGAVSASVSIDPKAKSVRLVNSGANVCNVRIGEGAQTSSAGEMPILAGTAVVVSKGEGENTLAYSASGGNTTLHVQTGEGGV